MRKIVKWLKYLWIGFILGMKKTEDETLHANGDNVDCGSTVDQKVSEHSVAKALLRGEVTQEVEDLRYRTYEVARESTHYRYFSPMLAKKKQLNDNEFLSVENEDGLEIVTIQENKLEVETVNEVLSRLGDKDTYTDRDKKFNININYKDFVRFNVCQFVKKVVVKKCDDEHSAVIDIYVSKYPDDKVISSKPFVREVERIKDKGVRSDILSIDTLSFETYKAYKLDDMIRFEFGNFKFDKIIEYDGDYVLRFNTKIIDGGTDLTKQYYSERMAKKYKEKAKKELVINYDPDLDIRVYKCADCGKEVIYDPRALDNLDVTQGSSESSVTEFFDYEINEQTFGRMLCKECAAKEQAKLYKKIAK